MLGNGEKEREYYGRGAQLIEGFNEDIIEAQDIKQRIAVCYQFLGKHYFSLGENEKALEHYKKYTLYYKELYNTDNQNISFKRALSISYQYLGNIYLSLSKQNNTLLFCALKYYNWYKRLSKKLSEAHQEDMSFKNELAISYGKLSKTCVALENYHMALHYSEKSVNLSEIVHQKNPENIFFKKDLATSYIEIGVVYEKKGDRKTCHSYYQKAKALLNELVQVSPQDTEIICDQKWVNQKLKNKSFCV